MSPITILAKAFLLFCDLNSAHFAYTELSKYLAAAHADQVMLSGYSETDLTTRPLNARVYAIYAQLKSADDFFAYFQTVFPADEQEIRPQLRAKICSQYNLYQFNGFIEFIRLFPEFRQHLLEVGERITNDQEFHEQISNIQGFAKHGFCKLIKQHCSNGEVQLPCC